MHFEILLYIGHIWFSCASSKIILKWELVLLSKNLKQTKKKKQEKSKRDDIFHEKKRNY